MKKLLVILSMVFVCSVAFAAPFITSDSQTGVESHRIVTTTGYDIETLAQSDGSVYIDMALFSAGWHDGRIYSCETAIVIDQATDNTTSVVVCESNGAPIRFKVPNNKSGANFRITE